MAIALVSHTVMQPGPNGGTSSAIDTTGANFLAANLVVSGGGSATISDSYGNVWAPLTPYTNTLTAQLYYAANATTGTGHTFTVACTGIYPGFAVAAFSSVGTSSPFDVQNGNVASSTTSVSTGSVTPNFSNELMVSGVGTISTSAPTISVGTVTDSQPLLGGLGWGVGLAYLVQTTPTAENPTWSQINAQDMQANVAFFQAAGASPVVDTVGNMIFRVQRSGFSGFH